MIIRRRHTANFTTIGNDFVKDLPCADVRLGTKQHVRIYGVTAAEIGLPLVEVCTFRDGFNDTLNLTVEQAEAIAAGLLIAAEKARK